MLTCNTCKEELDILKFYNVHSENNSWQSHCLSCRRLDPQLTVTGDILKPYEERMNKKTKKKRKWARK